MPARPSTFPRRTPHSLARTILFGLLALGVALSVCATLFRQAEALGVLRWMVQERMPGPRTPDAVAMEPTLLALVERVRQLAVLTQAQYEKTRPRTAEQCARASRTSGGSRQKKARLQRDATPDGNRPSAEAARRAIASTVSR